MVVAHTGGDTIRVMAGDGVDATGCEGITLTSSPVSFRHNEVAYDGVMVLREI